MPTDPVPGLVVHFEGLGVAAAAREAAALIEDIDDVGGEARTSLHKPDKSTQDMGTAVWVALLGTPAMVALAQGIAAYISRNRSTVLILELPEADGKPGRKLTVSGEAGSAKTVLASVQELMKSL